MSLIQKAKQLPPNKSRKTNVIPMTGEELDLYLAYMQGEVTTGQVVHAHGRSYGFAINWLRRCTDYLYQMQALTITFKGTKTYRRDLADL